MGAFKSMVQGYENLSRTLFAGAKDIGLLFVDLGKQIWNSITFEDTDFKGIFQRFGKNLQEEARRQLKLKPIDFGIQSNASDVEAFVNNVADIQDQKERNLANMRDRSRARILKAVEDENMKRVEGVKKVAKEEEKAMEKRSQQRVSKALVRGTVAAAQAVQQARLDAEILDANKRTADNTQTLIDIMMNKQPQELQVVKAV
jgi:3-oxoacyl-(acyl-carrier-protein) synthase